MHNIENAKVELYLTKYLKRCRILVIFLPTVLFLIGCTTIELPDIEGKHHYFIGITKLEVLPTDQRITALKDITIGVAFAESLKLGWSKSESIRVPISKSETENTPGEATCALVIIIRSSAEAEQAFDTLQNLQGDNICYVRF